MHVVEIFVPLGRKDGSPQPVERFAKLRGELIERFGGMTAFTRAPATGLWEDSDGAVEQDRVVIFEVMDCAFDVGWWGEYRRALEARFEQDEVLVRASSAMRV